MRTVYMNMSVSRQHTYPDILYVMNHSDVFITVKNLYRIVVKDLIRALCIVFIHDYIIHVIQFKNFIVLDFISIHKNTYQWIYLMNMVLMYHYNMKYE